MAHNRGGIEDAAVAEEDEDESDSTEDEDGRYSDEDFQDAVDTSNEQADTTLPDHPTVEIDGESAILLYPGVPTKCCHSGCSFVSNATGTVVATSIIRHLHVKHKQTLKRVWKCSKCGCGPRIYSRSEPTRRSEAPFDLCHPLNLHPAINTKTSKSGQHSFGNALHRIICSTSAHPVS